MADDVESQDEAQDFWKSIGLPNPDEDDDDGEETGEDIQEEYDEEQDKLDKTMKKYTSKMDERLKELDRKILEERVRKFQEQADPLEVDLFKAVAGDIKSPEDFDKAVALAKKNADKVKEAAAKYDDEYKQRAAQAWGVGPIGTPQPKNRDYEAERMEKIAKGDSKALAEALLEGFNPPKR